MIKDNNIFQMRAALSEPVPPLIKKLRILFFTIVFLGLVNFIMFAFFIMSDCWGGCMGNQPYSMSCSTGNIDYCCDIFTTSGQPKVCSNYTDCIEYQNPCVGLIVAMCIFFALFVGGIVSCVFLNCRHQDEIKAYQVRVQAERRQAGNSMYSNGSSWEDNESNNRNHLLVNGERYDGDRSQGRQRGY